MLALDIMTKKFERYHLVQSWLNKNPEIHRNSRLRAFNIICKKITETMDVHRVGIWLLTSDKKALHEELTFIQGGYTTQGTLLHKKDLTKYFDKISQFRFLDSCNSLIDDSLSELLENYIRPLNVCSMLDTQIFSDGEMLGVLCCETVGIQKVWDIHDKNFTASCSDFIGQFLESEKRQAHEEELHYQIDNLEKELNHKLDQLKESNINLDLAVETAQIGKWDWNLVTNNLVMNNTWFSKLEYDIKKESQSLETFKSVLHPEDVDFVFEELNKHLRGETAIYECHYRMITKSGTIQWCLDRGSIIERDENHRPLRMIGVNVNVTPMVKWEQSLITSEQQLKSMIRSLPTPVAMFDKDFNYLAFSSRWSEEWQHFGKPQEGISVKNGFRSDWLANMELAQQGKTISKDEDLLEMAPGLEVWLRWVIQPWKNANQEIGGVIFMAENITSRKEAEMRLTQASKFSALGEMAGGIAHEINNPLSIIKGYIDLLKRHSSRRTLNEDLLLQYIHKMDQTVARISRIVSGMRRFSRESSMDEKVNYSLKKIIEETLDICQERINNNGTALDIEFLQEDLQIYCRPIEISQVFLNLINNSYQATVGYTHPWIKIKMYEVGQQVRVSITDCGEGIIPAVRQKLFQPFFTTKDVGVGTGLGLSISRGIIEEHKGRLFYQEDVPNTTFVIELPKSDKAVSNPIN